MSEAESPDQQTDLPAPSESAEMSAVSEPIAREMSNPPTEASDGSNQGWQTVDFPGAMSVDVIPHDPVEGWHPEGENHTEHWDKAVLPGVIHYSSAEISSGAMSMSLIPLERSESVPPMPSLQEDTVTHDRALQVEPTLVQPPQAQPVDVTQESLQQLLQALERSHQTAQRQQTLVETLTEQLNSSQERIAQLEHDCALTQQRYNEQAQQVLQAEKTCRDLRLRLHRQQQQTLQFKAALEKSLEMPTAYGYPVMADIALASDTTAPNPTAALLPKNPPVKPWSLTQEFSQEQAATVEQPSRLFQLLNADVVAQEHNGVEAECAALFSQRCSEGEALPASADQSLPLDPEDPQFVSHLMQLIFPAATTPLVETIAAVPQLELLLDTTPNVGLEAEDAGDALPPLAIELPDRPLAPDQADAIATASPTPFPSHRSSDPLWDHLATLIDLPSQAEPSHPGMVETVAHPQVSVETAQLSVADAGAARSAPLEDQPLPSVPTSTKAIPPIFATGSASPIEALVEAPTEAVPSQAAWTWRDRLVSAGKMSRSTDPDTEAEAVAQSPSNVLALSLADQPESQEPVNASSRPAATSPVLAPTPSPIVYPLRPTKKLGSLAAVDLPMFPKR
ncbi:MAG: hypothetical protein RBJ76_14585 [Stenomitos frigidus ULC029]